MNPRPEAIAFPEARVKTTAQGAGGVPIAAYEFGEGGSRRPVLLIHGIVQSHMCWYEQLTHAPLLEDRRVAAMDLRGHGASGRQLPEPPAPDVPAGYAPSDFADDVLAVIDTLGLDQPVLVGWSYGSLVIADFTRTHGTSRIAGAVFVGGACRLDPPLHEDTFLGPGLFNNAEDMLSPELAASIRGTNGFLTDCFHKPLSPAQYALQFATNMTVPAANRLAMLARGREHFDEEVLPSFDKPALVVHGDQDTLATPASGEAIAGAIPGAEHLRYEDCGHAPFLEEPERFNRDLLGFLEKLD